MLKVIDASSQEALIFDPSTVCLLHKGKAVRNYVESGQTENWSCTFFTFARN